jgi:predicted aconitase with swiveling domain
VLLEAIKAGTAPAAILTTGVDTFFALASIVADELYHKSLPIFALDKSNFERLQTGLWMQVSVDGVVSIRTDIR